MKLSSYAFKMEEPIPVQYTCKGADINPPLKFSDVPPEAKSLVLIVDDPDAPSGVFVHWLVWNIDPKVPGIAENSVPKGAAQGQNDFGRMHYGGPCPPSGMHHYIFKLYALDSMLDLDPQTKKSELLQAMEGHILDSTILVGVCEA